MDTNCPHCGAPVGPSRLACEFCGRVLRSPASIEDEMSLVREQAQAATRIATARGNQLLGALTLGGAQRIQNLQALTQFWSTAFVPTTVPALLSALSLCAAGIPPANAWSAQTELPLVMALASRAEVLEAALARHQQASPGDRAQAQHVRAMLTDRVKRSQRSGRKMWWGLGLVYGGMFVVLPLTMFAVSRLSSCGKTPVEMAEEACRSGFPSARLTGCIEACGGGVKWACDMAASIKQGGNGGTN